MSIDNDKSSEEIILEYLKQNESIDADIAKKITGLSPTGVRKIFQKLCSEKENKLEAIGKNKSRYYKLKK